MKNLSDWTPCFLLMLPLISPIFLLDTSSIPSQTICPIYDLDTSAAGHITPLVATINVSTGMCPSIQYFNIEKTHGQIG